MSRLDTYERFDSSEDVEYPIHRKVFDAGVKARRDGLSCTDNPMAGKVVPGWVFESWYRGWEDEDMSLNAETAEEQVTIPKARLQALEEVAKAARSAYSTYRHADFMSDIAGEMLVLMQALDTLAKLEEKQP